MIKINKSFFFLFYASLCFLLLLTGCRRKDQPVIVTIGNKELTLDDFLYDIYLTEAEGTAMNEQYSSALGTDYWDFKADGVRMSEKARETILTRVILYDILEDQAKQAGLSLTEQELANNEDAVDLFLSSLTKQELTETGLTREILINTYRKISLGDKYYLYVSDDFSVDEESIRNGIDFEDYREYNTECLYLPTVRAENQEIKALGGTEKAANFEKLTDALAKIKNGSDFNAILSEYNEFSLYNRNFILADPAPEREYREAAARLPKNGYSDIVTTKFGYYIIHMLDDASGERYEKAMDDAVETEKKNQFDVLLQELLQQYDITVNTGFWDNVRIGTITNGK